MFLNLHECFRTPNRTASTCHWKRRTRRKDATGTFGQKTIQCPTATFLARTTIKPKILPLDGARRIGATSLEFTIVLPIHFTNYFENWLRNYFWNKLVKIKIDFDKWLILCESSKNTYKFSHFQGQSFILLLKILIKDI